MIPAATTRRPPSGPARARGLAAPRLWPLPARVRPGRLSIRWDPAPGGVGGDRRYELRLVELRTRREIASAEVRGTDWESPHLPPGGVYEVRIRARETLRDGTRASSAPAERRFRTGFVI